MTEQPIVVYTCIAGKYDKHLMPVEPVPGVRFVCFTDSTGYLKASGWEIMPLASPARLTSGHDINRYHKFFPHRILPDTKWSIYIDGNIRFAGDWHAMIARVRDADAGLGMFWHPDGHNLATEIAACNRYDKFDDRDRTMIDSQIAFYARHGIDQGLPIPTNNVIVRDHAASGLELGMSLWWSQLFEFTKRDQISLPFVLRQSGLCWQPLDGEGGIDRALLQVVWHRPPLRTRIRKRLRRQFGIKG
ncbi:hypothetical protein B2G71_19230 [Novosphingobium sp. PC22D]|uniref:glycosyltransferase domain-containing protein n=1 Tax=Novosphingobium sp. PC22D TaxID=1962403 RepID=UPI000BF24937|nr:glycosyltransferase domain-containing protein [Novosphingobium sp. PC22D]PEQ10953.1 hypothetical protein B2G71_19230 [Novosphingobium sp. PC22D]